MSNKMEIHIFWDGAFSLEELKTLNNESRDYGLYQIYGFHPLYGKDVLLYIGKANYQTFYKRLKQEYWDYNYDPKNIKIYIGRIASKTKDEEIWASQIDLAEKLLIYSHNPAHNTVNTKSINFEELKNTHVFNRGRYRDLFPEVSWRRWSDKFNNLTEDYIMEL